MQRMTETSNDELSMEDLLEGGDQQDDLAETISATRADEFFAFERDLIDRLLDFARGVRDQDEKLKVFTQQVVEPLLAEGKKLLVFTEYRATQAYLKEALEHNLEAGEILLIHGSMSLDQKLEMIDLFNNGPNRFLVSTEAGGKVLIYIVHATLWSTMTCLGIPRV